MTGDYVQIVMSFTKINKISLYIVALLWLQIQKIMASTWMALILVVFTIQLKVGQKAQFSVKPQ